MTIVYMLKCPKTNQVKYVGEGGVSRPFDHVKKVRKCLQTSNPRLTKWIAGLLEAGKEPIIEVVRSDLTKAEALAEEARLIKRYGRRGMDENGTLLNIAEEGRYYDKHGANNPFFGKKHKPETLEKMAASKRGKDRGEEFRETMRKVASNRPPQSEETRMKKRASMLARWELKRQALSASAVSHPVP